MDAGKTIGYFVLLPLYTDLVSMFHLEFKRIIYKLSIDFVDLLYILKLILMYIGALTYTCCRTAQIVLVFLM